jgi:hypothetical protein
LAIVTSSLRWVTVLKFGNVSLEPIHISLLALTLCFLASPTAISASVGFLFSAPAFWLFMLLYFLLSLLFLLSQGFNESVVNLLPQALYIPAFFVIYVCLLRAILIGSPFRYYVAVGLAIIIFMTMIAISAATGGADLRGAWSSLIAGASFYAFKRTFLSVIFNSSGFSSSSDQLIEYTTSIKNELSSCIVVLFAMMKSLRSFPPTWRSRMFEAACAAVVALVVVLSFSRSAFLALAMSLLVSFTVSLLTGRMPVARAFAVAAGFLAGVAVIVVATDVGRVLEESVAETTTYEARLVQYSAAFKIISENIWPGVGTSIQIDGHDIHNLFLATWAKSGILPLICILSAYLVLLTAWVVSLVETISRPGSWHVVGNPAWVFAIPIVPFLRVFLSGKGGTFSISMWLGAAAFLAFIVANRLARRRCAGASSPQPWPGVVDAERTSR